VLSVYVAADVMYRFDHKKTDSEKLKILLHYLLTPVKVSHSQMVLRPTYPYQILLSKATRCGRDFVPYCISKKF